MGNIISLSVMLPADTLRVGEQQCIRMVLFDRGVGGPPSGVTDAELEGRSRLEGQREAGCKVVARQLTAAAIW